MENMNEVTMENEVLENTNSFVKDSVTNTLEGVTTWLQDFKRTHYKNRPLTDMFFGVCVMGVRYGLNVRGILGEGIISDVRTVKPTSFDMYVDGKKCVVSFHI